MEALKHGVLPYRRLDICRLKGEWKGFLRLRVSDIRIIFKIDFNAKQYTFTTSIIGGALTNNSVQNSN